MESLAGGIRKGALAGAALACAARAVVLPPASGRARQTCNLVPDSSTHWEAVFGHTTSVTQAILMRKSLLVKGYRNIQFEKDYCDDIELYVPGLDDFQLRKTF